MLQLRAKVAHRCTAAARPAAPARKLHSCFLKPSQHHPARHHVIVAALGATPEEEQRLRIAIERQIKNSLTRIEAEQAVESPKRTRKEIRETAQEVTNSILEAVDANPDFNSVDVLRELATRTPLLSNEQVLAAVERQIQNAVKPRRYPPPVLKQDAEGVNIGFVPVVVPAPASEATPVTPVMSTDEVDGRKVGLLDETQLKAALELQLRRSLEARQAAEGKEGDVGPEAQALTAAIVEGVKLEPNHDSRRVMLELAKRVKLLSDKQLYQAISRQLANSSIAQEEGASSTTPSRNGAAKPAAAAEPEKSPYAPEKELDGCLVFTVDQLSAVDYDALLERLLGPQRAQLTERTSAV